MLIKNLWRVAEQMLAYRTARQAADELADRLHGVGGRRLTPAQCSGNRCLLGLVDTVLAAGSAFQDMDFPTRNLHRSAIAQMAHGTGRCAVPAAASPPDVGLLSRMSQILTGG